MNYLTTMTDDELERTLVQMPDDPAVLKEAARRFVPDGREAMETVQDLRAQLDELEEDQGKRVKALEGENQALEDECEKLAAECLRLEAANEMLNGVVEALTK